MKRVDVAIIGGSLAGSACAREFVRLGIDAVAFERDRFPREKVCGGFLSPGALAALGRLDLLASVRSAGAAEIRRARIVMMDRELAFPFPRPGLGISRRTLDSIVASGAPVEFAAVRAVARHESGFCIRVDGTEVLARVVVDAAGKLSRFSKRRTVGEFGVQFYEPDSQGDSLGFWFFQEGYGGAVTIEDGRSNACFLVAKTSLPRYIHRPGCLITGPLSYRSPSPDYISIGDAAGMIDPFCGEGIHHALDSARMAAESIALGLRSNWPYARIRRHYAAARLLRWGSKRVLVWTLRGFLPHRTSVNWATGMSLIPKLLDKLWGEPKFGL
jgi:flavin-dependent dehydrogenase